ncbi:MAG TPA: PQQ-dependent sugar dehydrogenase [Flavisolibacter sp.]|jgi:glucose/arabinose dehydrogenase|nr:PQQ-dependent sugar dehydrogenase [Flavisolibacter sp.]
MKKGIVFSISCALALMACSPGTNADTTTGTDTTGTSGSGNAPVETKAPNSNYKPAFAGQTRIRGVKTSMKYKATVLTSALEVPWGITSLPDGRLLITQRTGQMRIVTAAGAVSEPITGLPKVNTGGQGGLLGLCLDPDFAINRMVYFAFSDPRPDGNCTSLGKGRLADNERTLENVTTIYRAEPAYNGVLHYGGRVVFDKAGNLYLSTGERSDLVTRPKAQLLDAALGKVVRLTKDGKPAAGNPFAGQANARPEIFTLGHRNPQSLAIHPATGELWEGEFGPRGGDEINRLHAGGNYGWPTITYGIEYSGEKVGGAIQQKEGLEQPVYYWDPVVSPSGMTFYSGDRLSEWKNNLFIGALSGQHIVRLVIENNKVTGEERLLAGENQRFRDLAQGKDGALYAITDAGRLYRIDKE